MLEDFTYDSLLQICEDVQGKVKIIRRKTYVINTVKNVMWKELCILI